MVYATFGISKDYIMFQMAESSGLFHMSDPAFTTLEKQPAPNSAEDNNGIIYEYGIDISDSTPEQVGMIIEETAQFVYLLNQALTMAYQAGQESVTGGQSSD